MGMGMGTRRQGDKETRRQGDKGTREQGDGTSFPLSPCLLVSLSPLCAAPSIFILAARADFVEEPDTLLGMIQNILKRVAGRRVAVLLAYFDRGALPFG